MKILISSHKDALSAAKKIKPTHIISITDPGTKSPFEDDKLGADILYLNFYDITDHRIAQSRGKIAPTEDVVRSIYNFGRKFDDDSIILAHCFLGISRSSAASIISLTPNYGGMGAAKRVGDLKINGLDGWNFFQPNHLMISIFDKMIGFDGDLEDFVAEKFMPKK